MRNPAAFTTLCSLAALLGVGCGGSPPVTAPPPLLSVAGTYQTAVSLLQSTCVGTVVETFPTIVTHTPGASTLTVTHAGSVYTGTVSGDASFRTPPAPFVINRVTYMIDIVGQFTLTAMDATVTVQAGLQPPCQFTARWVGPKTGSPNVIP
jgi:hypothetical protein